MTQCKPKVSVVIPLYNHASYIEEAIHSVLHQSCQDLEVIVIDDGSTDDSEKIVRGIDDDRIRYYAQENRGAHEALNRGIALARGDYIGILNSDDVFEPDRLEECLTYLRTAGADLVGTDITLFDAAGERIMQHWWLDAFSALKRVWDDTHDWMATLLEGNVFMTASNFVFTRALYDELGVFRGYRYVHDYEWLLRALIKGRQLAWVATPLLRYRLHGSNTILGDPLVANTECAFMLRDALPPLLGDSPQLRRQLDHLVSQWARIDRYVREIYDGRRQEAVLANEADVFRLIEDRDRWIAERDGWIRERDQVVANQRQLIEDRDRWIAERDILIRQYLEALVSCQETNRMLQESYSVRIGRLLTAPARWLRQ
jgi:glycosyltransferase involved in cell wall biosynthesis